MEMDDAVVGSRVDVDYCGSEGICIDVVAISAACVIVAVVTHMHTHIFAHQIIVGRCKLCHICTRTRAHTRTPLWCSRTRKRARTQAHWCAHTHDHTKQGWFISKSSGSSRPPPPDCCAGSPGHRVLGNRSCTRACRCIGVQRRTGRHIGTRNLRKEMGGRQRLVCVCFSVDVVAWLLTG